MTQMVTSHSSHQPSAFKPICTSRQHPEKLEKVVDKVCTIAEVKKKSSEFVESEKLNRVIYDDLMTFYRKFRLRVSNSPNKNMASEWLKELVLKLISATEKTEKETALDFPDPIFKASYDELSRINENIKKYKAAIGNLKNGEYDKASRNIEITMIGLIGAIEIESLDDEPTKTRQLNTPAPISNVTLVSCTKLSQKEYEQGMMDISNLSMDYVNQFVEYMHLVKLANYGLDPFVRKIEESFHNRLFEALKFAKEVGGKFAPQPALKDLEAQEEALKKQVLEFDKTGREYLKLLDISDTSKIQNAASIIAEIGCFIANKITKVTAELLESRDFIKKKLNSDPNSVAFNKAKENVPDVFLDTIKKKVVVYCTMVERLPDYVCQLIHLTMLLPIIEQFNPNIILHYNKIKLISQEMESGLTVNDDYLFSQIGEVCKELKTYSSSQEFSKEINDIQLELSEEGNLNLQIIHDSFNKIVAGLPRIFPYVN